MTHERGISRNTLLFESIGFSLAGLITQAEAIHGMFALPLIPDNGTYPVPAAAVVIPMCCAVLCCAVTYYNTCELKSTEYWMLTSLPLELEFQIQGESCVSWQDQTKQHVTTAAATTTNICYIGIVENGNNVYHVVTTLE